MYRLADTTKSASLGVLVACVWDPVVQQATLPACALCWHQLNVPVMKRETFYQCQLKGHRDLLVYVSLALHYCQGAVCSSSLSLLLMLVLG